MARPIADIQADIVQRVQSDTTLSPLLTSTSVTAIWRLWTYVVAVAIWLHEQVWERYRADTLEAVAALKPHTLRWYRQKALDFQLGRALEAGKDTYDNTGLSAEDIEAERVVKYAAANEKDGQVIIKVAKDVGGEITPMLVGELLALLAYMVDIKDAGVLIQVRGVPSDRLKVKADVYYDATVLNAQGGRLDGSAATPVQDAIKSHLKTIPFDGRFIKAHLVDAMQAVEGVITPELRLCQARRNDDPSFASVDAFYDPYSGFLRIYDDADLEMNFIAV